MRSANIRNLVCISNLFTLVLVLPTVADAALVGHWILDESPAFDGMSMVDVSGQAHYGTLVATNAADRAIAGKIGGAVDIATNGDAVRANLGSDLATGNNPFTISAWINPDVIDGSQNYVFSYGAQSSGDFFSMTVEDSGGNTHLRYRAYAGFLDFDASSMTTGSGWHHVAAVLPSGNSAKVGDFEFYLDGAPLTLLGGSSAAGAALHLTSTPLHIGNTTSDNNSMRGQVDDVRYYNNALSPAEVADLAVAGPSLYFQQTLTDAIHRTAGADGESPDASATSGWGAVTTDTLFVRERANLSETNLRAQGFLKFDLADLMPFHVVDARLILHEYDRLNSVNTTDMTIARVLSDWDETGGVAPVFGDPVAGEFVFGTNGSGGPAVDITHVINVTDFLRYWQKNPGENFGMRLALQPNYAGAAFDDWQLVVTQRVPEPSTLALAALGLLGLAVGAGAARSRRARGERGGPQNGR